MDASRVITYDTLKAFGKGLDTGNTPTVSDIVSILNSGVNPGDASAMSAALKDAGFNSYWAYHPVVSDIYTNYQSGAYNDGNATTTTTQTPAAGDTVIPQSFLGAAPGMPTMLRDRESWLDEKFGDYISAQKAANEQYGGVLESLANRLNDPGSRVSFGLEGFDPVSFMPRQTLNEAGALEALAGTARSNQLRVPTEQWAWNQSNPIHTADMQIFDLMNQLANQEENRRYGIPTQINTSSYTGGKPDVLTLLAAAGNLANTGLGVYEKGQSLGFWG